MWGSWPVLQAALVQRDTAIEALRA